MTACPPSNCAPIIKRNFFINISGSAFNNIPDQQDCSRGLILLTNSTGLMDLNDPSLGAFLTPENRVRLITSFDQSTQHFSSQELVCRELEAFFNLPVRAGSRPPFIYIGLLEAGKTMVESFQEIEKCPNCFWTVVPSLYSTIDVIANELVGVYDTPELFDLQSYIRSNGDYDIKVPTIQGSTIFNDPFETTSEAAKAAADDSDPEYVLCSYDCISLFDEVEDPITGEISLVESGTTVVFNNDALLAGAIASSYSAQNDELYNFTEFLKPIGFGPTSTFASGRFVDDTTISLATQEELQITEAEIQNATGISSFDGSFIPNATRSVSLFINTTDGPTYVESLRVNRKQFADSWYKEKAVNDELERQLLAFMSGRDSTGISAKERRLLAGQISIVARLFEGKEVINPTEFDWASAGYENILVEGLGYVITVIPAEEIEGDQVATRNGNSLGFCFIVNEPQHRIGVQICEIPVSINGGV